jgi:dihydrofolate reductase/predicted SnoaL-like aldol condensation-catalyzing enzyme
LTSNGEISIIKTLIILIMAHPAFALLAGSVEFTLRKLILFDLVSLDGYFEGSNHAIDWHNVDAEFQAFALAQLDSAGLLLFGRVTYELMAGFWPSAAAARDDPLTAAAMNRLPKLVFSRTLKTAGWQNTRLVKENILEEVRRLKEQPGKDIYIFGSSDLSVTLIQHGLIDEFRLLVNPLALGAGTTLFHGLQEPLHLQLLKTQTFRNGNVLLVYQPEMSPFQADPLASASARKEAARQFLELVGSGRIDEAYRRYVAMEGKHHNPFIAAGFPALQAAMHASYKEFPDMRLTIQDVIAEGDMLAVHSHVVMRPHEPGYATVHWFRFQGGKIVEMWDIAQALLSESPNQDGMF